MTSTLTAEDKEAFFIRLYFDTSKGYFHAAMQRAYRDFNRTIKNIPSEGEPRRQWRYHLYDVLKALISQVLESSYFNQVEFDEWHKSSCADLTLESRNILTIGQAQKWINMTLKYLYAFGEKRITGISRNYLFFHIPIDNIIQKALYKKYTINLLPMAWSKIPDYPTYLAYQISVRKAIPNTILLDEEFRLFNENF